jgi:hypothetical protein
MTKYGVLSLVFFSLLLWGCADESASSDASSEGAEASIPVDVALDEEGTPLPCSAIADELLANEIEGFVSSDRVPEKLEKASSQSCSISLLKEGGIKMGDIRFIVKPMEARPNREEIAKRAKNTQYVDDLPVPAMYRQLSSLTTLVFDHGLHTYNLNISLNTLSNQEQYELARSIALHIVDNIEE